MTSYNSIDLSEVVNISDWYFLDEGLAGSRAKQTAVNPETDTLFVFKEPKERREAQIWSELLASYICGDLLGWPVQHSRIAMRDGRIGNLLEYIFDPKKQSFLPGELLCKHYDSEFDPEVGTRHTWQLITQIHDEFLGSKRQEGPLHMASKEYKLYWGRTIAFDTLISNTDRHAENWAFSTSIDETDIVSTPYDFMAPFFDNASSMGCEVEEIGLEKWFNSKGEIQNSKVEKYARRGCHHIRNGARRYGFTELAQIVLEENPTIRGEFEAIASLDMTLLEAVFADILGLVGIPPEAHMSHQRKDQIASLLRIGQSRVIRCLEESP
ncbi:MAG: hypothetical protein HRU33_00540 [Rhodobacteraceae bacterium]|nr:hypothetical protein [Paracoccaceae bacterium]